MSVLYAFVDVTAFSHGGYKVVIVAGVLIVMLFLMVFGRLISRRLTQAGTGPDDYVLFIATVLSMGLCAIAIACKLSQKNGFDLYEDHANFEPSSPHYGSTSRACWTGNPFYGAWKA